MAKRKCLGPVVILIFLACQLITTTAKADNCSCCTPFFLELGTGVSFSRKADISVDLNRFDPSPQGYNSSLNDAPIYMAGVGYVISPLLNIDVNVTHRGFYDYKKFQTSVDASNGNPLGDKTRFFRLFNNTIMFNATLNGQGISPCLAFHTGCRSFIQPFVGAGLGVAYNTLTDFHTILADSGIAANTIPDQNKASFAYQFNAGLEWRYQRLSIDVGYRYFNGDHFETNNYFATLTNVNGTPITPRAVTPWTGKLTANELFATLKIAL